MWCVVCVVCCVLCGVCYVLCCCVLLCAAVVCCCGVLLGCAAVCCCVLCAAVYCFLIVTCISFLSFFLRSSRSFFRSWPLMSVTGREGSVGVVGVCFVWGYEPVTDLRELMLLITDAHHIMPSLPPLSVQQLGKGGLSRLGLLLYTAVVFLNICTMSVSVMALKRQHDRDYLARMTRRVLLLDAAFDIL